MAEETKRTISPSDGLSGTPETPQSDPWVCPTENISSPNLDATSMNARIAEAFKKGVFVRDKGGPACLFDEENNIVAIFNCEGPELVIKEPVSKKDKLNKFLSDGTTLVIAVCFWLLLVTLTSQGIVWVVQHF